MEYGGRISREWRRVEKVLEGRREDFMSITEDENEDYVGIARFPDLSIVSDTLLPCPRKFQRSALVDAA